MKNLIVNKILTEICPDYPNQDKLKVLMTEWLSYPEYKFIGYGNDGYGTLRVVVKANNEYTLLRFFPGGEKWYVSVDKQDVSADQLIVKLIEILNFNE